MVNFSCDAKTPEAAILWGFLVRYGEPLRIGCCCLFISVQPFAYVVADYTCHNREYKVKEFYQNVTPSTVWLEMGNDMDEGHYRKIVNSSVYEVFTIFEIDE